MKTVTTCLSLLAALCALALIALPAHAADTAAKPTNQSTAPRTSKAKAAAPSPEAARPLSEGQLKVAERVLTGDAECELHAKVSVEPIQAQPGYFKLRFKNASYTMVPEETTSGAVRLEDKKAGMVWLQIPSKSMLMNARAGQRVADGCLHPEQRAALAASQGAGAAGGDKKP